MMRRLLTVTLPVVLLILSGPAALAAWSSKGGGSGSVTATTVNQASQPTATAGAGFVTISWARSTLASGDSVGRYLVFRGGAQVCTSTDTSSPTASCVDPAPASQTVTYTVVAAIGANWRGLASPGTQFTYDNTAPGAPSAPDLIAAHDTGTSNSDNITNLTNVTVTGTAEADSTVRIYRGDELLGSGTATDGVYSIGILLVEGSNTIHATATDAAGNVSASSTLTIIVSDTASPGAPSAPDLVDADDTGVSNTDNITSMSSIRVQGTAEAGATVKIYRGSTLLGTGVATGGSYSIGDIALIEGQNDLHATATDEAGNVSSSSVTTIILSDSAAPAAPSAPDLIAADDTGTSDSDDITSKAHVTVVGTAEAGSTVRIYRETTELGQGPATSGSYSIGITLVEGNNTIHATATDAAGNVSVSSSTTLILRDTGAPTVTGVSSTALNGSYGVGAVIPVSVTFSEPVSVAGTPQLALATGNPSSTLVSLTSSSGNTLTFNYTVVANNASADLDYVGTGSLTLNGGTIRDAAGNNASLALANPGATGSLGANKNIVIDTISPTVSDVELVNGGTAGKADLGDKIVITFSERLDASSVCSLWSNSANSNTLNGGNEVTVTIKNAGQNGIADTLIVESNTCTLNFGTIALDADYVSSDVTFKGPAPSNQQSLLTLDPTGVLTITLGSPSHTNRLLTVQTPVPPRYTHSDRWRDIAGNSMVASTKTGKISRF